MQPSRKHRNKGEAVARLFPDLRKYAAPMKEYLRRHGHDWKFYDSLDSYVREYEAAKSWAVESVESLWTVHECSVTEFHGPPENLHEKIGVDHWELLYFTPVDVGNGYGVSAEPVPGVTAARTEAFRDEDGSLRTVIFIVRKAVGATSAEISAGMKLPALFHEVGHALDWQEGKHLHEGEVRIIDAEIEAHRFSLRECLNRQYFISLDCYVKALKKMAEGGTYEAEVYQALDESGLLDECSEVQENAWWKVVGSLTPTAEDLTLLKSLAELVR